MSIQARRSLPARITRGALKIAGWSSAGILVLILIAILCVNLHPVREYARARINRSLAETFVGTVVVDRIGYVGVFSVGGLDARILDANQRTVVVLKGLSVRSVWPRMLLDLLHRRPLTITLDHTACENADITLVDDGNGAPTLTKAFLPRHAAPTNSGSSTTAVLLPRIRIRHIWAHGGLSSMPVIDGEVSDLEASLDQRPSGLVARLSRAQLRARALPAYAELTGTLSARANFPAGSDANPSGFADFEGRALDSTVRAHTQLERNRLDGHVSVTIAAAGTLRKVVPSLALSDATTVEFQLEGDLPRLKFQGYAKNSAMELALDGHAELDEPKRLSAALELTHVNLAQLTTNAPSSDLTARLFATLNLDDKGRLVGNYRATVPSGRVNVFRTPSIETLGALRGERLGELHVQGDLRIHEPGADTRLAYQLHPTAGGSQVVDANLAIQLANPSRAKTEIGVSVSGSVTAQAKINLSDSRVFATASVDAAPVSVATARLGKLQMRAKIDGRLRAPVMKVEARATDVAYGPRRFRTLSLAAAGTQDQFSIDAQLEKDDKHQVALKTTVAIDKLVELVGPSAVMTSPDGDITLRARSVSVGSGTIRVDHFELAGAGDIAAQGVVSHQSVDLNFNLHAVQIARIMRSLGFSSPLSRGLITAEGTISGPIRNLHGKLTGHAGELAFNRVSGGNLDVNLELKRNVVSGVLEATLGDSNCSARFEDLDVPGAPLDRASLLAMRGTVSVAGTLQLENLAPVLRNLGVPVEQAKGEVRLDLSAERPRGGSANHRLALRLKTKHLEVVEERAKLEHITTATVARAAQPTSIQGIDLDLEFNLDESARETKLYASLVDSVGPLVHLNAEAPIPDLKEANWLEGLKKSSMKAEINVPERNIDRLPNLIRPQGMRGYLKADIAIDGNALSPRAIGRVAVRNVKSHRRMKAIDGYLRINYATDGGEVVADAYTGAQKVAQLTSKWTGDLIGKLRNKVAQSGVSLNTDLMLAKFPVDVVPTLSDLSIRGTLSCDVALRDWGKNATLQAKFDGSGLTVHDARLVALDATVQANDRGLSANLRAEQRPGKLDIDISAPMQWGDRLIPLADARGKVHVVASQFQIATLDPLLLRYASEIEGNLDADLNLEFTDGAPRMQGTAQLQHGVVEVPQVGQRFSDISAKIGIAGEEIRLESLAAHGTSGRVTANGIATLDGTELETVKARVDIQKRERLPITFEGVAMGDAWGHIDVAYTRARSETVIRVDVPDLHVQIPDEPLANVQALDSDDHVKVGVYREDGKFAAIPVQPLTGTENDETAKQVPTRMQIHLGDSVWVERTGQAKVNLRGDLTVTSAETTRIDGRIELRGGQLDVNGKTFEIERGVVAFSGKESVDPTITATARWDSPAGYAVYADFSGTVKKGKLTLHSEPQLTQNEIVSLLVVGSTEGSLGSNESGGGTAATAAGVAGDTVAKGLNRVMSDFTHLDVSARVDTSTGSARPELVVQVTPRLTTRVSRALGEPTPGESPDRTFLTMDLRLKKAWALSAIVGDRGASTLDLIWRKRY